MTRDDAHREAMHTLTDFTQSMPAEWDSGDESRAALASWLVRRDWRPVYDDDATVETLARALIDASVGGPYHMGGGKWAVQGESRDLARAALAALRGSDV